MTWLAVSARSPVVVRYDPKTTRVVDFTVQHREPHSTTTLLSSRGHVRAHALALPFPRRLLGAGIPARISSTTCGRSSAHGRLQNGQTHLKPAQHAQGPSSNTMRATQVAHSSCPASQRKGARFVALVESQIGQRCRICAYEPTRVVRALEKCAW